MSNTIRAIRIQPPFEAVPSQDGRLGIVRAKSPDGQDLAIEMQATSLAPLIEAAADLQGKCAYQMGFPSNSGQPIVTEWLEVGGTQDGRVVISFQMKNKAMLRFLMEASMAQFLQTVLASRLGSTTLPPATPQSRSN